MAEEVYIFLDGSDYFTTCKITLLDFCSLQTILQLAKTTKIQVESIPSPPTKNKSPNKKVPKSPSFFHHQFTTWVPGDLRYVKLDVQRSTSLVQATLVWNAATMEEAYMKKTEATNSYCREFQGVYQT